MHVMSEKTFCFGKFALDLRRGCLRAGDREVELRPKSFEVLRYLVENAGRLIPKDEIIEAVWPSVTVTDESLTRCVSDIRLALEDADQSVIKTMTRRGYVFTAPVSIGCPGQATDDNAARGNTNNGILPFGMLRGGRFSLVVLPFVDLSDGPAQDHLADAITDGLTTYLSRIRDAFVIARSIAMTYKGRAIDVRQIGRELGVRYVLEGSEQHSGSLVRVNAQLIDVDTGAHLWAERFDAHYVDLLQAQDEIVTRLARALQIEMTALESARISPSVTVRRGAEDLGLAGEAIYLRYGPSRRESESGFQLCERALAIDPNNVRALGILAEKTTMRVTGMQSIDRDADIRRSAELVARALAADPNSYHAHHAKARLLVAQKRAEEALIEAERSLRLNPGYIPSYLVLCQANLMLGLPKNTIEHARKVKRLSPPDPYLYVFHTQEGLAHIMLGEDDLAVACLRQAVANNPEFPAASGYLVAGLALIGKIAEAREQLERYLSLPDAHTKTVAGWRNMAYSEDPAYLAMRHRIYEGLRKAGMAEQ
jgi:TolB-like protein/DNA-binding winged helix-turn-helix (wHTH) protein